MFEEKEVHFKVISIMNRYIKTPDDEPIVIQMEDELAELGINSISYIRIMMDIEVEFSIEFGFDEDIRLANLLRVKDLVQYVMDSLAGKEKK